MEMTNSQSVQSRGMFTDGESTGKHRGRPANMQRTTPVTEVFPAITFVKSRRAGVVPASDEI